MLPVSLRNSSAMAMFSARRRWGSGPRFVHSRQDLRDVACPAPEFQRDPVPPHVATRAIPVLLRVVILPSSRVIGSSKVVGAHRQVAWEREPIGAAVMNPTSPNW